jgi:hypothetical protein
VAKLERSQDSDPFPYLQFHRSAVQLATQLGLATGLETDRAIGRLVLFWLQCSEPRAIERLIHEGKTSLVLSRKEAETRIGAAFGKNVSLEVMVIVGILSEEDGDKFRVRGLSRQFKVAQDRIRKSEISSLGGKASVLSRNSKAEAPEPKKKTKKDTSKNGPPIQPDLNLDSTQVEPEVNRGATQTSDVRRQTLDVQKLEVRTTIAGEAENYQGDAAKKATEEREKSIEVVDYEVFEAYRRDRLKSLGVEFVPDEKPNYAFITAAIRRIKKDCVDDDELWDLMRQYTAETFPAAYDIPYKFKSFTSKLVWPGLLSDMRGQPRKAAAS